VRYCLMVSSDIMLRVLGKKRPHVLAELGPVPSSARFVIRQMTVTRVSPYHCDPAMGTRTLEAFGKKVQVPRKSYL